MCVMSDSCVMIARIWVCACVVWFVCERVCVFGIMCVCVYVWSCN